MMHEVKNIFNKFFQHFCGKISFKVTRHLLNHRLVGLHIFYSMKLPIYID